MKVAYATLIDHVKMGYLMKLLGFSKSFKYPKTRLGLLDLKTRETLPELQTFLHNSKNYAPIFLNIAKENKCTKLEK